MASFKFSNTQMEALGRGAELNFVAALADFLREELPGGMEEQPGYLDAFASRMVKKAGGYGLRTQRDAAIYATAAYLLGEDFEQHFHSARRTLEGSLPGPDKAQWLSRSTVALIESQGRLPE